MVVDNWLDEIIDAKPLLTRQQRFRGTNEAYREREHKRDSTRDRTEWNGVRRDRTAYKPFIGWDTEGSNVDATPFLFGSSEGHRIAKPGITTREMFDLLLEAEEESPDSIHIIYGGEYDFNMMLRNVDLRNLWALKNYGKTTWHEYKIEHIPRKWLIVKKGTTVVRVFDVVSFFAAPYVTALLENQIGTEDEVARIKEGKRQRESFTFADLDFIEPYWRTELKLLPELMDKLREAFYRAGVFIHYWHGPGALARYMLRHHKIKECMARDLPEQVHTAARFAFCGGRFEPFQAGLYEGRVINRDVNSAYPYAATLLPDLSTGYWEHVTNVDRSQLRQDQFAVWHIRYEKLNVDRVGLCVEPQPLFRRLHDDRVQWPNSVEGWYWSPEAYTVRDNRYAEFIEGWVYHDSGIRPFKWLSEYYDHRRMLKVSGDPMQLAFKLGPNSVYGQLAQRAGWQRYKGPPTFHQIEWAGFITSVCRAMVYEVASYAWEQNGLISIDTDGVYATCDLPDSILPNGTGSGLGQWEASEVPGVLNWQSGVYWVKGDDDRWELKKARGAPKGQIPFSAAIAALPELKDLEYKRNELIGYRWGLRNGMQDWRYFVTKDRRLQFGGSEFSKRFHQPRACRLCRGFSAGTMHDLYPVGNGFARDPHSKMHVLPWEKSNDHERIRDILDLKGEIVIDEIWSEEG